MTYPTAPQMRVLIAAIRNGGQIPRGSRIAGVTVVSIKACIRHGWLDTEWNIVRAGRDAALAVNPKGYAKALPAGQVDAELADVARRPTYVIARYRVGHDRPALFDGYLDKPTALQRATELNADAGMIGQADDQYRVAELRPLDDTEEKAA